MKMSVAKNVQVEQLKLGRNNHAKHCTICGTPVTSYNKTGLCRKHSSIKNLRKAWEEKKRRLVERRIKENEL